jgi:transcriptional regulator with XRE-family HTH domain
MRRSQIRAARALLEWSQERLAKESGISVPTIKRLEPGEDPINGRFETIAAIQRALEAAGVEFTNGGEPGVKLRNLVSAEWRECAARIREFAELAGSTELSGDIVPGPHPRKERPEARAEVDRLCTELRSLVDASERRSVKAGEFEDLFRRIAAAGGLAAPPDLLMGVWRILQG